MFLLIRRIQNYSRQADSSKYRESKNRATARLFLAALQDLHDAERNVILPAWCIQQEVDDVTRGSQAEGRPTL